MNTCLPILALDLSTKTGWALSDRNGRVTSGIQEFDLKRGESKGMRFLRFRKWLKDMLNLGELGKQFSEGTPGLIIFEQAHFRGGYATELLVGFMTDVLAEAALYGLDHTAVHTATLKKFATGHGKASKEDMIAKAKTFYPEVEILDDNHADALLLLKCGMSELGLTENPNQ
jgi:Holliday junction resolvasome RuvABC endonuclease subunit